MPNAFVLVKACRAIGTTTSQMCSWLPCRCSTNSSKPAHSCSESEAIQTLCSTQKQVCRDFKETLIYIKETYLNIQQDLVTPVLFHALLSGRKQTAQTIYHPITDGYLGTSLWRSLIQPIGPCSGRQQGCSLTRRRMSELCSRLKWLFKTAT
jgi:hypothetical protein